MKNEVIKMINAGETVSNIQNYINRENCCQSCKESAQNYLNNYKLNLKN